MSLRSNRISQDYAALKKMLKKGEIIQLEPFNEKSKSIDHLKVAIKGLKALLIKEEYIRLKLNTLQIILDNHLL